jgi:hypothetical protein
VGWRWHSGDCRVAGCAGARLWEGDKEAGCQGDGLGG